MDYGLWTKVVCFLKASPLGGTGLLSGHNRAKTQNVCVFWCFLVLPNTCLIIQFSLFEMELIYTCNENLVRKNCNMNFIVTSKDVDSN